MTGAAVPLTILHLNTERGWRGGERQALWLAEALARAGHRSFVVARPGEPLAERARQCGLPTVSCAPVGEFDLLAAARLRRALRVLAVDVVHAHTAHALALAAVAAARTPVRVVASRRVDVHLRRNAATRWKYSRADAIVAVSNAARDVLVADGIPAAQIVVVRDGVDLARTIAPAAPAVLADLGIPPDVPLVMQVAHLVRPKDPVNFVRAVAVARRAVPALHALMVGDGALRGDVEREIARLGLEGTVHLAGHRPDADALLAAATVVVLSSRDEGLGSVLLDALMLGKPIVATRAGGIPEAVEDGVSGLLAAVADPDALGAHIARVLQEPDLAARLAAGARAGAAAFSMERTAEQTLEVYRRVLAVPRRVS